MKKLLFATVVAGLFVMASCSKSSTSTNCVCKTVVSGTTTTSNTNFTTLTHDQAVTACNAESAQIAASNPGSSCSIQ